MKLIQHTRRDFSMRLTAGLPLLGIANRVLGLPGPLADRDGIVHSCESIHQEVVFKPERKLVYEALTEEKQFRQVTEFIMKGASAEISREVGGAFSIFGGVISGRHVELKPFERIVQAWREKDWPAGVYSIVRFQLEEQGPGTKLIFDHAGFPEGAAVHLAPGWWSHYWEPLRKYLG